MSAFRRASEFLKIAWGYQPVIVASIGISIISVMLPVVSPWTKYTIMINEAIPYTYPVPVQDDGNMADIPTHPCDKEGPSLEWLKNL
ncbi:hypothetical protein JRQ81_015289 [Phrynocephalus forsythii]|uniref:NADH dehydrogenase [ubiquinone] 1 alpha subcomplex subunit 3 n=1 Tax=Phrynocephalus forsythii TaxID=171643 RepID=A0A9Q0XUI4_9SAUR|nr:hypothetical protein JRQ81_015289 [Phrynocephalus forsythii]